MNDINAVNSRLGPITGSDLRCPGLPPGDILPEYQTVPSRTHTDDNGQLR